MLFHVLNKKVYAYISIHPNALVAGHSLMSDCVVPKTPPDGDGKPSQVPEQLCDFERNMRTLKTIEYEDNELLLTQVETYNNMTTKTTDLAEQPNQQQAAPQHANKTLASTVESQLDGQQPQSKKGSQFLRTASFLQRAKAAGLAKQLELKKQEQAQQPQQQHDSTQGSADAKHKPVDDATSQVVQPPAVQQASLPPPQQATDSQNKSKEKLVGQVTLKQLYQAHVAIPLPTDFQTTTYVSADQQQPPKKRGRKPKVSADTNPGDKQKPAPKRAQKRKAASTGRSKDETPLEPAAKKARAAASSIEDVATPLKPCRSKTTVSQPKAKAKRSKKSQENTDNAKAPHQPTAAEVLEMLPVPREDRSNAQPVSSKTNKKHKSYEAQVLDETCTHWDTEAVASAAHDVACLESKDTRKPAENDMPINAPQHNAHAADTELNKKAQEVAERKKLLSRKSCAYKKARGLALKQGKSREEAAEAGKKVTFMNAYITFLLYYGEMLFP